MDVSIPNDAFISCQSCQSKNASDSVNCSQCNADLLPGRPLSARLLFGGMGIIGLAIPLIMWIAYSAIPTGLLLVCIVIPMITFGFAGAFSRAPLTERLTNRANRHLTISLGQSVIDYTGALQAAPDNATRCGILVQRGEALMRMGRLQNALSDFEEASKTPAPDRKQLSQTAAYTLWKNHTTKALSKINEIRQSNPNIIPEVLDT